MVDTISEEEYHIKFPLCDANFMDTELTFSINHVKSREISTLYFYFKAYNDNDELIYTYESDRWVIYDKYSHREDTFIIPQQVYDNCVKYQIILVAVSISSENPLVFNEVMLQEGEFTDYHIPMEVTVDWEINFKNNSFANLYSKDGVFLQVIRPLKDAFLTNKLTKSECTVLAPHLYDEPSVDSAIAVFLEFVNQTEQRIGVLR